MSDLAELNVRAIDPQHLDALRHRAASRLGGGAAGKGPTVRAVDALAVLHALASAPATAADALTLLHELQVHQVELDLQAQELRDSRAEVETALRRQVELYDFLPVGSFTVDARSVLHELNRTGAEMLGVGRDDAIGLPLDTFFEADSARRLRSAIASVDAGAQRAECRLTLRPRAGAGREIFGSVAQDPAAKRYLVALMHAGDGLEARA